VWLLAACSSQPASFDAAAPDVQVGFDVPNRDVPRVDRGPTPEVIDLTDVPPLTDAGMRDGPCAETLPGSLRYGSEGGFRAYNTTYSLSMPRRFLLERTTSGMTPARCETTVPACGAADDVTVDTVTAALGNADVGAAFQAAAASDAGTMLYGVDERPFDGSLFFLERDGRFVYVGAPCRTGMGGACTPAPVGLQRLVDVLTALADQESRRPVCAAVLGDGGA
jgi:hypothetical protein